MRIELLVVIIGLLFFVWLWVFTRQIKQSRLREKPVESKPVMPVNLIDNKNGLIVAEGRGHVVYINSRAREWFGMNGGEPNLAVLAARAHPQDVFHDLFAEEGQASFRLGTRRIQATSHSIPTVDGRQMVIVLRELNTPVEEEILDPSRALLVLQEISQVITAGADLRQTLNTILNAIRQIMDFDAGEINLWNPDLRILRPTGRLGDRVYGDLLEQSGGGVYALDEGFSGWIARYRQPLWLGDVSARPDVRPKLESFNYSSYLGLPLLIGDRFIGTLELAHRRRFAFDQEDMLLLQSIAGQAAIAVENARLSSGQATHLTHLSGLQQLIHLMDSRSTRYELNQQLTERIANLIGVEMCGLFLYQQETDSLISQIPFFGITDNLANQYRIPVYADSIGYNALNRQPWWYTNNAEGDKYADIVNIQNVTRLINIRSMGLVPLAISNRRTGVIMIANKRDNSNLNDEDMRLLSIFAAQTAVIIENTRLLEREKQHITELAGLQNLARISAAPHSLLKDFLSEINPRIADLLRVETCGILFFEANPAKPGETVLMARPPFHGIDEESIRFYQMPVLDGSVFDELGKKRDYWLINNLTQIEDRNGASNYMQLAGMLGLNKVLMAPLVIGTERIGVLQVANKRSGENFSDDDIRLMLIAARQTAVLLENLRTSLEVRRLERETSGLRRLSEHSAYNLKLDEALKTMLPDIAAMFDTEVVALGLLSTESGDLVYRSDLAHGVHIETPIVLDTYATDFDSSPVITRKCQRTTDATRDPKILASYRSIAETFGLQAMMLVPMMMNQRVLGEILLGQRRLSAYAPADEELAQTVGAMTAAVIERTRLTNIQDLDILTRYEEQEALDRISRELGETLLVERVMNIVRAEALRTTHADDATVVLFAPSEQWVSATTPEVEQRIGGDVRLAESENGNGNKNRLLAIEQATLESGEAIIVNDYEGATLKAMPADALSAIAQPIKFGTEVVGIIHLYSQEPRRFTREDLSFVHRLGQQASLAVSNARRFNSQVKINERLRRRANQIEQIFSLSQMLREGASLAELMQEVAYAISETVGFGIVMISTKVKDGSGYRPIAQAGLPIATFEASAGTIRLNEQVLGLMQERWKVSNSYFLPADFKDEWKSPDLPFVESPNYMYSGSSQASPQRTSRVWDADDLLLIPMLDSSGELLGYISPDAPLDKRRPDMDTFESLEVFAAQASFIIENFQLVESVQMEAEATRRERDRLAQLHLISSQLQLAGDLRERLQIIADGIVSAGWRRVQITLRDEKMESTELVYAGYGEEEVRRQEMRMLPGSVWRQRFADLEFHDLRLGRAYYLRYDAPWVQKNIYRGGRKPDPLKVAADEWHPQDVIYMPLVGQDQKRIIGLIRMEGPVDNRRPGEDNLRPVELFALQAAAVIENTRLYDETVRQAETEQRLNELMEAMASTLDQAEIIEALATGFRPLFDLKRLHLAMPDENYPTEFELTRVEFTADEKVHIFPDNRLPIENTALGKVFRQNKSEVFGLTIEYRFKDFEDLKRWADENEQSTLMVPMIAGGRTIGVLRLGTERQQNEVFSDAKSLTLIERMANLAAVSIQNSRLFTSLESSTSFSQAVVEAIQQGIVVLDAEMNIRLVNAFMITRYGWSADAVGRNLFAYRPDFRDFLEHSVKSALETGKEEHQFDIQDTDADNKVLIRNFYTYPLRQGERVTGVVLLVEDITERSLLGVELASRADQLAALTNVSNQMTETLQPDQVVEVVLDALARVIPYDGVALWLLDEDNADRLKITAARGFQEQGTDPAELIGLWAEISSSLLFQEMAERQKVLNVGDTASDTKRFPYGAERAYRNWLGAPLISKGKIIGLLQLEKKQPNFYSEHHEQLVTTFANQAAVALNNAQLFAEAQERADQLNKQAERLELLNRVSVALAHSLDQENIFEITLREMSVALGIGESAAIRIDTENNIGRVVIEYPRGDEEPSIVFSLTKNRVLQLIRDKLSPQVIEDVPNSEYADELLRTMRRNDVTSALFVPLVLSGAVVGILRFDATEPRYKFTAQQIDLAQTISSQAAIAVQNASLYEQSVRRTYELQTLFDASQSIAVTLDSADVMRRVATLMLIALQADTSAVMMWNNADGYLELAESAVAWDELALDPKGTRYNLTNYPVRQTVLSQQKVTVLRSDDDDLHPAERLSMQKLGISNRLFAPLIVNEIAIGLVQVEMRDRTRFFENDHIRLVRTLTTQTAIAIENARLQTETRNQIEELFLINDISKAVSSTVKLETLLEQVRGHLPMLTDAQYVYVVLYNSDTHILQFPLVVDQTGEEQTIDDYLLNEADEFGYIIKNHATLVLNSESLDDERRQLGITASRFKQARSFLGIPMMAADQVTGILALCDEEQPNKFTTADQRILTTIGSQLGVAIQNARLFQQTTEFAEYLEQRVQERTHELEQERQRIGTLYEIASEIAAATLDVDRVLSRTLEAVSKAINATSGVVLKVDDISDRLYVIAHLGLNVRYEDERLQLSPNQGLAGWIIQNRQGVVIPDVQNDFRWVAISDRDRQPRSCVASLLETGEEVSGVVMFYSEEVNAFNDDHLRLVSAAASQLANSMNNAELYGLIRDQAERLGAMLRQEQIESTKNNAILNSIADGVMYANEKGIIRVFNSTAERILGLSDDQVMNRHINELTGIYGGRASGWTDAMQRWMENPTQTLLNRDFIEEILDLDDGRVISVRLSPVNMGDQFLGTVSVFRDITREVEVDRLKSEFVANVSHELRTPMTSIKGYSDLLLLGAAGEISEAQQRFLHTIKQNADRLSILVNDLLEVSRLDQNRKLNFTPVDVGDIVHVVSSYLAGRIKETDKEMNIVMDVPSDLPPIRADYDKIIQVIQNLADNAFNYTPTGGTVTIAAQYVADDKAVIMMVKDTGIGIPEEIRGRVFERFFRGDEYNQMVFDTPGTGLGLAIVKELVTMHEGEIWFSSMVNEGTTFYVKIPVARQTE